MLADAVASVDDGHGRTGGGGGGGAFVKMTDRDRVGVARHHAHGVGDAFAFDCGRAVACILHRQNTATELLHRRFETQAGARAGFVEQGGQDAALQHRKQPAAAVVVFQAIGCREKVRQQGGRKL